MNFEPSCRICLAKESVSLFQTVEERDYLRCSICEAIFLKASQLPDIESERGRYALHNNDPTQEGYRKFLGRLSDELLKKLPAKQEGLDYGCGPSPVLAQTLKEEGHRVSLYDPAFFPDTTTLAFKYDFIVCSEVAEHFHYPAIEFQRLNSLLKQGGFLAVMTSFQIEQSRFANWHYRRDLTHVAFYNATTFNAIALRLGWSCEIPARDVVIMQKI